MNRRPARILMTIALALLPAPALALATPQEVLQNTVRQDGLLPVHVDRNNGRVILSLPAPDAEGIAGRFIYVASLETGLGSAALGLDRALSRGSRLLVFRRVGKKIVAEIENPRFRASGAPPQEQEGVRRSFAYSTIWMNDIAAETSDGRLLVDISGLLTRDDMDIARALREQDNGDYRLVPELSVADVNFVRVFPRNIELRGRITFASARPGPEVSNIVPVNGNASFIVRHSLIALPDAGYQPRRFDPRAGTFGSQVVDFAAPLGSSVVYEMANRFRLEKVDPGATRSRVRNPITFYIDTAAPEPIRTALLEGTGWWREAFEAAGYIDAFRVEMLPEGVDPLDIRYNVVNWVNRATRGWSYGQVIEDPRTGEIIKGQVLLGSLRVRQDMLIFQGLVGAGLTGSGGPNDPVAAALARIRQLAAHEVGHALGLSHNFAASIQGRYSVMDYPAPRIRLVDGALDLGDAYGIGIGPWDRFAVNWLYGARTDIEAQPIMAAGIAEGLRFVGDDDARPADAAHPIGSLWDDFADPVAELRRMMEVRAAAVAGFGPGAISAGEPLSGLRRAFVPIWLLHRYQLAAAAKLVGGLDYSYAVAGDATGRASPVPPAAQRQAIDALIDTLSPEALTVPAGLVPHLSAGWSGNNDRQTEIEIFPTAGGPVFDPLAATEIGAMVTLAELLAPERLNRLELQNQAEDSSPGAHELVDALIERVFAFNGLNSSTAAVKRRIATTTALAMARAQRDPTLSPTLSLTLSERIRRLADDLSGPSGNTMHSDWSRGLGRLLNDDEALQRVLGDQRRLPRIPPGMPIGAGEGEGPGF
ncbi:MAG TPA: zinc-dependent metalloprotease [Allosphingosinicella sp.]|nr:zinc-dependent metalloprotease [Allosphingosinicella sp.]